jgi:two-component system sensor histidine kinase DesK
VRGLRSVSLDSELARAQEALEAAGIEASVRGAGPLPAAVETLLGFAAREAVTNVIRHSRARRCEILVRHAAELTELEVRDDGTGAPHEGDKGSGLRGLSERMAEAGGTLEARPAEGGGFRLLARVPIAKSIRPPPADEAEPVATGR